jgi:hypothetical protein
MMLYPDPEWKIDPRKQWKVKWRFSRKQVSQMTAFTAKNAGEIAESWMKQHQFNKASYRGQAMDYRSNTQGLHYELIKAAMREKLKQNPEVKRILKQTEGLILRPDHFAEENAPPEWNYVQLWMEIRDELR